MRRACLDRVKKAQAEAKKAEKDAPKGSVSPADAKLINETNAAAKLKLDARDFAGAAADYQKAIDANPQNGARHLLYLGLGLSLRRQAIAAYNEGQRPPPPPPGAGNDAVRAFNAAVAVSQGQRRAATVPLLERALVAVAQAATLADAQSDKAADQSIGLELREDASLLYTIDRQTVLTKARASAALEATWLRRWLTATIPLPEAQAAKYGMPVAAALVAQDPAAGLALAEEVKARTGSDPDGALEYAEIVLAAKRPVGDPARAKALAGLTAVDAAIIDRDRVTRVKAALAAPQ